MNFTDDLLVILSSYSKGYALMRRRMHGYTGPALSDHFKNKSSETIRALLDKRLLEYMKFFEAKESEII